MLTFFPGIGGLQELEREHEKQQLKNSQNIDNISSDNINATTTPTTTATNDNNNATRIRYLCEECDKYYLFTPPEILRHKKTHS